MNDFFTRLAGRVVDGEGTIRPRLAPRFAALGTPGDDPDVIWWERLAAATALYEDETEATPATPGAPTP